MTITHEYYAMTDHCLLGTIWCDEEGYIIHSDTSTMGATNVSAWMDEMDAIANNEAIVVSIYELAHPCNDALSIDCECGQYAVSHLPIVVYSPPSIQLA